jgi:hypothetical protein
VLESKLDAMHAKIENEMQKLRDEMQHPATTMQGRDRQTGGHTIQGRFMPLVTFSTDGWSIGTSEVERYRSSYGPDKTERVEKYVNQHMHHSEPVELSAGEKSRLEDFTKHSCSMAAVLHRLVPCEDTRHWLPGEIIPAVQELTMGVRSKRTEHLINFMDQYQEQTWFCARMIVACRDRDAAYVVRGDGTCWACKENCLQISPLETDGRPGQYRGRMVLASNFDLSSRPDKFGGPAP